MLTVPESYTEGLVLLMSTPSGAAILETAAVARTVAAVNGGLGAHGHALDDTTIHVSAARLDPPLQACVLAHELTHCIDFAHWGVDRRMLTAAMVGATEINAHYNQGLIAKELSAIPGLEATFAGQVATMVSQNTTFGKMADAWDRDTVYRYLAGTRQYGDKVRALRHEKILYLWTKDSEWERGTTMFHCEAHLDANSLVGPTWG